MNQPEPKRNTLVLVLRAGLLIALVGAGWRIYQRLPMADTTGALHTGGPARSTMLHIILHRTVATGPQDADTDVRLFPVDVAAVQREYDSERRPGLRFNDFLVRRMQGRAPVAARFDANGQTVVTLTPGRWWVHATLTGPEELTWRLPVNVTGREQTVELTPDNAYMRTKSF
ncbi:MAG TPA: hypothetical protein VF525_05000 [Pyrinomonadaceae bacterium]